MIVAKWLSIPNWGSLLVIITVLVVTIFLSMRATSDKSEG